MNHERTGQRDLGFSRWHRALESRWGEWKACDIDLAGFCPQCHRPLYLIEDTQQMEGHKGTTYVQTLAAMTGTPAWLVRYRHVGDTIDFVAEMVWPSSVKLGPDEFASWIAKHRACHMWTYHNNKQAKSWLADELAAAPYEDRATEFAPSPIAAA